MSKHITFSESYHSAAAHVKKGLLIRAFVIGTFDDFVQNVEQQHNTILSTAQLAEIQKIYDALVTLLEEEVTKCSLKWDTLSAIFSASIERTLNKEVQH